MLSGTHDTMKKIEESGNLDNWCMDNLDWLKETFGEDNLVSAVLHMDEKTPHIHATIVPIVSGERRKVNNGKQFQKNIKRRILQITVCVLMILWPEISSSIIKILML